MTRKTAYGWVVVLLALVGGGVLFRAMQGREPEALAPARGIEVEARDQNMPQVIGDTVMEEEHDHARRSISAVSHATPAPAVPTAPPVPPGMTAESLDAEARPPWMEGEGGHAVGRGDGEVRRLAEEIARGSGPFAAEHAKGLLESEQETVGVVGAALLLSQPVWDAELMETVAGHRDPAVPLFALQGLLDAGRTAEAAALRAQLHARFTDYANWTDLTLRAGLSGTAARGLLDLAGELAGVEDRMALANALLQDVGLDYSGRMRAVLEFWQVLPFEEYRSVVRDELAQATDEGDPVWREGIQRLADRLAGPAAVHAGPVAWSVHDVEVLTARPFPAQYEDLALQLEVLTGSGNALFGHGVRDALAAIVAEGRALPDTDDAYRALDRIERIAGGIEETDITPLVPPPPPGS